MTSEGLSGVFWVSRRQTASRPSGETRGLSKLYSGALSSTWRFPLATSIMTRSACESPAGFHCHQPVSTAAPSGVSSNDSSSSARPGWGVKSRSPVYGSWSAARSPVSWIRAGIDGEQPELVRAEVVIPEPDRC